MIIFAGPGHSEIGKFLHAWCKRNGEQFAGMGPHPGGSVWHVGPGEWREYTGVAAITDNIDGDHWLVAHNAKHIFTPEELEPFEGRTVNCHPSYLPWGRGAHPIFHCIYNDEPLGVTLHQMVPEVDAGPLWMQEEWDAGSAQTLRALYALHQAWLLELFLYEWPVIYAENRRPFKTEGPGSSHRKADLPKWLFEEEQGWDTTVERVRERADETKA